MSYDPKQQSYVISAPPPPKPTIRVVNGGSHRGAMANAPALADFNKLSERAEIHVVYADVLPGRAAAMVKEAQRLGLTAEAYEGKVEDLVKTTGHGSSPIILNVDRASAIAAALSDPATASHPILGYLLLRLPSNQLWAVRFVLTPEEATLREEVVKFFTTVAGVSERNTSSAVVGDIADPAHRLVEPQIRAWFAEHTKKNLEKIAAGVEPATAAVEVTMNGVDTLPLFIVAGDSWAEPAALAEAVLANPQFPIRRQSQFVVAELVEGALRFHAVRRRSDDKVTVGGVEVVDRASVDARDRLDAQRAEAEQRAVVARAEDAERSRAMAEALAQAAVRALTSASRETVSRRNPVATTD
jgi:hypothetical protein